MVEIQVERTLAAAPAVTELEVTEYVENERVRMVADSRGTLWDTTFVNTPDGYGSQLTLSMDCRSYKWMSKLMAPLSGA